MPCVVNTTWPTGTDQLQELQVRLLAAPSALELFARACGEARKVGDFDRALVVVPADGRLTAATTGAIEDPASDQLRRRLLADPVALTPGSVEQALLRGLVAAGAGDRPSVLAEALDLDDPVITPIAPRRSTVALVVADGGPASPDRQRDLDVFAHVVGLTLEIVVGRSRLVELREELHVMYASAEAVINDALESSDVLAAGSVAALNLLYPVDREPHAGPSPLDELLTTREHDIARLMVAGRSNREIAVNLSLSSDTVKGYVAKILRKLGASNRVEAVGRYLELAAGLHQGA